MRGRLAVRVSLRAVLGVGYPAHVRHAGSTGPSVSHSARLYLPESRVT